MSQTLKIAEKFKSEYEAAGMELGEITIKPRNDGHAFADEAVLGNPEVDGMRNCKFVGTWANFQDSDGKILCYVNFGRNTTREMKDEYSGFIDNFLKVNGYERGY